MKSLVRATALVAGFAIASSAGAAEMTFKMGHAASDKHPFHTGVEMFAEQVKEGTDGAVEIQVFGNRQLGDDKQLLEGVRLGTIDGALVSSVMFSLVANSPAFDALQLPFLVDSYDQLADALTSETAQKMLDGLASEGMKGLGFYEAGLRHFLNSKGPVRTVEDFQGLKTRIVPVPLHKATWEAVGANPVGIAYGEVYTSMQTGVIDAVEFNISSIETENLWENAKYVTLTGHYFWPGVLVFNKDRFDELPAEVQEVMIEAGHDTIRPQVQFVADDESRSRRVLEDKGVEFYQLEDLDKMRSRMEPILEEWRGRDPLIAEYIDMIRSM